MINDDPRPAPDYTGRGMCDTAGPFLNLGHGHKIRGMLPPVTKIIAKNLAHNHKKNIKIKKEVHGADGGKTSDNGVLKAHSRSTASVSTGTRSRQGLSGSFSKLLSL